MTMEQSSMILLQVQELKGKMQASGMPWPGDEGEDRWELAWMAIKRVRKLS